MKRSSLEAVASQGVLRVKEAGDRADQKSERGAVGVGARRVGITRCWPGRASDAPGWG
jgi:hypothetical protein